MAVMSWCLASTVEGDLLAELPLSNTVVRRAMSGDGDGSWTFSPTDPKTPASWHSLIEAGGVMVVALLDGDPLQAWPITEKDIGSEAPMIAGPTFDGLLSRVFVRDYEAYGVDEAFICADIAEQVFSPGFNFTTTAYASGTVRDVYYDGTSDMTVRQLLDEYAASSPPIEFVTDIGWAPGEVGSRFQKGLRVGSALGDVRPDVIFDSSCIVSHKRKTSFAEGYGATRLWAVADGSGSTRPITDPAESDLLAKWGPWESRPSFTTVADDEGLVARRDQNMRERQRGTEVWQFVLSLDNAPRPGRDWDVGDTVNFDVAPSKNDPVGGKAYGRVLALEVDTAANTVTPTLAEDRDGT